MLVVLCDTDAPVASDGTYGRECCYCSDFTVVSSLLRLMPARFALECGFLPFCREAKKQRGVVSKVAKALKTTPGLQSFEIASVLER